MLAMAMTETVPARYGHSLDFWGSFGGIKVYFVCAVIRHGSIDCRFVVSLDLRFTFVCFSVYMGYVRGFIDSFII